jgi:chromosome segregation ATPase
LRAGSRRKRYSVYFLYWYKSTNTDAALQIQAWKTEVLAMRSRMESEAASKDRKIEKLQEERDDLQNENAELRNALQSAEASLAVQTAAVQRVEKQTSTLMIEVRQCRRSEEEWRVQGEEARAEVAALQIQVIPDCTQFLLALLVKRYEH